ncbi:MAG: ATP-binding protein, partial [Candidatus Omnitrophica bacterium]|nr:ATP-binding protein [Candidatus Omnitrophota bacterium]
MSKYIFPSDLKYVNLASQKIIDEIISQEIDPGDIIDIKLCFEEAFINAVKHGNCSNCDLKVNVQVVLDENSVGIFIRDEGDGFDFENCPDPTKEENL